MQNKPQSKVELSSIHNFAAKLQQPEILPRLKEYVCWQNNIRKDPNTADLKIPNFAPVSINLDITTSCNFACPHCVDMKILNKGIKYQHEELLESLKYMAERGLKSVIVIGGGEPTLYHRFEESISFMKSLGLQIAIVTNGSRHEKLAAIAHELDRNDWIRFSIDAAYEDTFQAMHRPKIKVSLDDICAGVPKIKEKNSRFNIGFSFVITWKGANINDSDVISNIDEIVPAAKRARDYQFDYISYKPFLTRAENNNAEVVDLKESFFDETIAKIRRQIDQAKEYVNEDFKVYESTNLKVLENKTYRNYSHQPENCHIQFFRQVLSPLGVFNCPGYRNHKEGELGDKCAYLPKNHEETRKNIAKRIQKFNATQECKEVTCLYNHVNWWIEDLIEHPEKLDSLEIVPKEDPDFFL